MSDLENQTSTDRPCSYLMYAASALAANTVCRSACGAAAPLFTEYMFTALGVGGGGSLIGGVAALLAVIPILFWKYGEGIRRRSKFAPTPEKEEEGGEEKVATKNERTEEHRRSELSASEEEEAELDEEAGVPNQSELEQEIKKERSRSTEPGRTGNGFIDASGLEKAE